MKSLRVTSKFALTSNVTPLQCYTPKEFIKGLPFTVALTAMSMLPTLAHQHNTLVLPLDCCNKHAMQ